MKILHTADWHIGSFKGPERDGVNLRSEDTMDCLRKLVDVAREERPELVLVSGDIFHQAEVWQGRSHREVLQARQIILELSEAAEAVVVMRGTPNHDSQEAFDQLAAHFEKFDNVWVVSKPDVIKTAYADIVAIPGFDKGAFRANHPGISKEEENIVFSDELGNIVAGMRAMCDPGKRSILMSHYTVPGCNTESGQTQFLTQFEPIISQDMLIAANYDLVALGHIHRPQKLPNLESVYYSGAVNAMNFNDEGQERGFWIHEELPFGWQSDFHKTPYREFYTVHLNNDEVELINGGEYELVGAQLWKGFIENKIVRVLYNCTADNNKVLNKTMLEKVLMESGAFWVSGIEAEKIESANRTELSKQEDPETNLVQYLKEKLMAPERIDSIVEKARPIIAMAKANASMSEFFGTFVPKEIEVKNYRNYVEQYFSFADISFCTINGQNGSGKSSLFMDAIVDCLYEEPREGTNTGWIRNDEKARSGSISFTFGLGDKTFRVVRTRTKSGKPTLNLAEFIDGVWSDRSKEKIADTQKEIIRILGMDSLTFKACVLIMQDQYGLFLEAGKEERVGVLSNLLGLGIYGVMEDLSREQLANLKREIAKKNQTINIHSGTIDAYGNPEEEKADIDGKLTDAQGRHAVLIKEKEEKTVVLRMQREAEERRNRVQASVDTLMRKKAATEQNITALDATIANCSFILQSEAETMEKAARHAMLLEQDRELASAAVSYSAKHEELVRLHNQETRETDAITRMQMDADAKQREIESLSDNSDEYEIKAKAAEYEHTQKLLGEAYDREREYRSVQQELAKAMSDRAMLVARYEAVKKGMLDKLSGYRKQAELLDNVECVDIGNAKCGFLAEAIAAKQTLDEYPSYIEKSDAEHQKELAPYDEKITGLQTQLNAMDNPGNAVMELQAKVRELKPYVAKLEALNQRESRIAVIRASIDNIQSNISEAQKRLTEAKIKASEVEQELASLQSKVDEHRSIQLELTELSSYVQKAGQFPVIKERKTNAENQKTDEILRVSEIEQELIAAKKELDETVGATLDTVELTESIRAIDMSIDSFTRIINEYQRTIGSLNQKITEIGKLRAEIKVLQEESKAISLDISDYDMLKAAFSQDGIPHQIIRSLVPRLTEISSSILGQMTGGKMGIEFQTEKVLKSNTNKEIVTLDILIEEYGKTVLPYLSKSGGEKVKASLSVILALAEIKSSTAGIQLGMLFIDEPPFLDGDGVQAYCDALETIQSRYPELKIMAITHDNSMKARFPQSLDVVKTDEGSKVIY